MGRFKVEQEETLPIEERYRELLRAGVRAVGGQIKAGELADLDQGTISRALADGGRVTYATLVRLSRKLPNVPAPFVGIRDEEHAKWCRLGAILAQRDPEQFAALLRSARRDAELAGVNPSEWGDTPLRVAPTTEAVDKLKSVITNPLPRARRKRDRGS